jgi:AcrR family transcriptional regulator
MVKKKENTDIRQHQIIDAARLLIFKFGSEHLTVKRIATQVGISEADIYKHFKSKKSILSFLLTHIEESMLEAISLKRIAKGKVTLGTIEKTIHKHFSTFDLRKGISFQVIAEIISLGDKNLNNQASQVIGKYLNGLKDLLAEGIKSGSVRDDIDIEAAATVLFGLIQGLENIWSLSNGNFKLIERYTTLWQVYREAIIRR